MNRQALETDPEERFRLTFDEAPTGMAIVGLDGRWLQVNAALSEITGYPAEDLLNLRFQDITHPDDREVDLDVAAELIAGRLPRYSRDKRYVRPDGTAVWVHLTVAVARDRRGRPLHFVSQIQDVTAERTAAEESAALAARYRSLVDHLRDSAVFVFDADSRVEMAAGPAIASNGTDPGTLVGRSVDELVGLPERAIFEEAVAKALQGESYSVEYESLDTRRWYLLDATPIPSREQAKAMVVARDVTERRRARSEHQAAERRYRLALEHAPLGVIETDTTGICLNANRATEALLGLDGQELIGSPVADLFVGDHEADLEPHGGGGIGDFRIWEGQYRFDRSDGSRVHVLVHSVIVSDADGRPERVISYLTDVTVQVTRTEDLDAEAHTDRLTGLLNRAGLERSMNAALARGQALGVLFMDLNGFKVINDTYGHSVGDEVLQVVGERLRRATRSSDVVGRFGGDEMVVVTTDIDDAAMAALIRRLHTTIEAPMVVDRTQVGVGLSIGISHSRPGDDPIRLLARADESMYRLRSAAAADGDPRTAAS